MDEKKSFLKSMADKLNELDSQMEDLKKKGKTAASGMSEDMKKMMEDLKLKKTTVDEKMQKVKSAGGEGFDELKKSAEFVINDLGKSIEKAINTFKNKPQA